MPLRTSLLRPVRFPLALFLTLFIAGCGGGGGGGSDDDGSAAETKCEIGSSSIGDCEIGARDPDEERSLVS